MMFDTKTSPPACGIATVGIRLSHNLFINEHHRRAAIVNAFQM